MVGALWGPIFQFVDVMHDDEYMWMQMYVHTQLVNYRGLCTQRQVLSHYMSGKLSIWSQKVYELPSDRLT